MSFELQRFGEICITVIPLTLFITLIFHVILGQLTKPFGGTQSKAGESNNRQRASRNIWMQLWVLIHYIFFLGTVIHEAGHYLCCKLFGIEVQEVRLFIPFQEGVQSLPQNSEEPKAPDNHSAVGSSWITGYVKTKEITSFLGAIAVGIAPLILNGVLLSLLVYFDFFVGTAYYGIALYITIALILGAKPSFNDWRLMGLAFRSNLSRAFLELFLLIGTLGVTFTLLSLYTLVLWQVLLLFLINLAVIILAARFRRPIPAKNKIPRM
ncbi:MAG: hypothetical protein ACTSRS_13070 [Candidatus Helarchaeota archaeon]